MGSSLFSTLRFWRGSIPKRAVPEKGMSQPLGSHKAESFVSDTKVKVASSIMQGHKALTLLALSPVRCQKLFAAIHRGCFLRWDQVWSPFEVLTASRSRRFDGPHKSFKLLMKSLLRMVDNEATQVSVDEPMLWMNRKVHFLRRHWCNHRRGNKQKEIRSLLAHSSAMICGISR